MSTRISEEENLIARARRAARKLGLRMQKSRQRTFVPNLDNFGHFMIVDEETGFVFAGERYDWTPEDMLGFANGRCD